MKLRDFQLVMRAIENCENREKIFCEDYCKLNPGDRKNRERDRDLVLLGLMHAKFEIHRMIEEDERRQKA